MFHIDNPYLRLLSSKSVELSAGTRPIIMYIIAVDDRGTREEQKSLNSIASFVFRNKDGQVFNNSSKFTDFVETSFQQYNYPLPTLEEDDEGSYTLTLRMLLYSFAACLTCYKFLQVYIFDLL